MMSSNNHKAAKKSYGKKKRKRDAFPQIRQIQKTEVSSTIEKVSMFH